MTLKSKIIIAVVALLTAFAFGRFSAPEKVKIEKEVVKSDQTETTTKKDVRTDADRDRHVETTVTERTGPDGTQEKTTKVVEDTSTRRSSDTSLDRSKSETKTETDHEVKTVERSSGRISISALAGVSLTDFASGPRFGGHIQRNLLGPIAIGVWGFNTGQAGLSLGLSF